MIYTYHVMYTIGQVAVVTLQQCKTAHQWQAGCRGLHCSLIYKADVVSYIRCQ
jgi:hypothetical protein